MDDSYFSLSLSLSLSPSFSPSPFPSLCRFMLEFLAGVGVTPDNFHILQSQCGRAISWLTADSRSFRNGNNIEKFLDAIFVSGQSTLSVTPQ